VRQFRTSVLGIDVEARIAKLPEEVRKNVVSSFAFEGGMDGIELAARLAQADPSPNVQVSVIEALHFRRTDRFAAGILRSAKGEVWQLLAQKGYVEEIADQDVSARLRRELQHYIEGQTDPLSKLCVLFYPGYHEVVTGREVGELIEATDFQAKDQRAERIIYEAYKSFPGDVTSALIHRLEGGLEIPFQAENLLQAAGITVDEGPIVKHVIHPGKPENVAAAELSIIGPKTIGGLIDSLVEIDAKVRASGGPADDPTRKEYFRLKDWISKTGLTSFIQAVLSRSVTDDPLQIALLAALLDRHGKRSDQEPLLLVGELKEQMIAAVGRWAEILLTSSTASRSQLAEVACAIGRLAAPELLPMLQRILAEDLKRWRLARDEFSAALSRGIHIQSDARFSWTPQYRHAFAAIGGDEVVKLMKSYLPDPDFGFDAACVLKAIWDREHNPQKNNWPSPWPDFFEVKARRLEREKHLSDTDSSPFVDAIFAVIDHLAKRDSSPDDHLRALQLAKIAFSMPYCNKTVTIERLLELPNQLRPKRELLAVLVLAGEIISADMVLDSIKTLLEEAKGKPSLLDEQHGDLDDWLELLPFSDRPEATIDGLELLESNLKQTWRGGKLKKLPC